MINSQSFRKQMAVTSLCRDLSEQLMHMGVQVQVFDGAPLQGLEDGGAVGSMESGEQRKTVWTPAGPSTSSIGLLHYLMMHRKHYDVLHSHGFIASACVASRLTGVPLVQKITDLYVDDPLTVRKRKTGYLLMYIYQSAWAFVASSKVLTDLCRFSRPLRNKTIRIPNGVNTVLYRPADVEEKRSLRRRHGIPEEQLVLLALGPASWSRGTDTVVKTMHRLRRHWNETPLLLIASAMEQTNEPNRITESFRYQNGLLRSILDLQLQNNIRFETGMIPLHEYMKMADIYLYPFRQGLQPNGLLEAMSCGLPVIANLIPGLTDELVQSGRFGFTINCEETLTFAAALNVLLKNNPFRQRIGRLAREEVLQYYDIKNVAAQYLDLYVSLLQQKHLKRK